MILPNTSVPCCHAVRHEPRHRPTISSAAGNSIATEIGPATRQIVDRMLDHRPEDRLRMAGRLLKLGERFGPDRLEAACARALRFDDPAYMTVKHILEQGLDAEEIPSTEPAPAALAFVRTAAELVGHLTGGMPWR